MSEIVRIQDYDSYWRRPELTWTLKGVELTHSGRTLITVEQTRVDYGPPPGIFGRLRKHVETRRETTTRQFLGRAGAWRKFPSFEWYLASAGETHLDRWEARWEYDRAEPK